MLTFAMMLTAQLSTGSYGLTMHFVAEADAPIVGKVTTSSTTTALVDVVERDGKLVATQRACGFATDGGLFAVTAGPAFLNAMAPVTYELVVEGDHVRGDMGTEGVGVKRNTRTLPHDLSDPAYIDPDGDGHKGVPLDVDVGGMKLHIDIVNVGHAVLEGTLHDGRVDGRPHVVFSEERIVGGIPEFLAQGKKTMLEQKSSFSLEPLAHGGTCRDVAHLHDVAQKPSAASTAPASRT